MQTISEFRHRLFVSAAAIAAFASVAACGGTDSAPGAGSNTTCTIALSASTDDAHLQVIRVERDEGSVRVAFEAVPETGSSKSGE